jgi:hypothetical protein
MMVVMPVEFHIVSKRAIDRDHPVDLITPVWFPALAILACANGGCEDCLEALDRNRYFPLVLNAERQFVPGE